MANVTHALDNFAQLAAARLVSTGNLAGVYFNGATNSGVGATLTASSAAALTIDSVAVVLGDRVLLMAQTNGYENGIYEVIATGSSAALWQLQRTGDFQSIEQLNLGAFIYVFAGTANAGAAFTLVEPLPAAIGVPVVAGANDINFTASPLNSGFGTAATKAASDNAEAIVASVDGPVILNNLARFDDTAGTIADSGILTSTVQLNTNIKAATTGNIGGAGAGPITVPVVGLTAASVVVATIETSTNTVAVGKATAGVAGFDVLFSADPGATCTLNYVAFIAPQ